MSLWKKRTHLVIISLADPWWIKDDWYPPRAYSLWTFPPQRPCRLHMASPSSGLLQQMAKPEQAEVSWPASKQHFSTFSLVAVPIMISLILRSFQVNTYFGYQKPKYSLKDARLGFLKPKYFQIVLKVSLKSHRPGKCCDLYGIQVPWGEGGADNTYLICDFFQSYPHLLWKGLVWGEGGKKKGPGVPGSKHFPRLHGRSLG